MQWKTESGKWFYHQTKGSILKPGMIYCIMFIDVNTLYVYYLLTRMVVVHGQFVETAVCISDLYMHVKNLFSHLLDITQTTPC